MIGATWNIRSISRAGHVQALSDLISDNKLDFITLLETKQ
jgi:exonuclease III